MERILEYINLISANGNGVKRRESSKKAFSKENGQLCSL